MVIGICVLTNVANDSISGTIEFKQIGTNSVEIIVNVKGLTHGFHGFHIHEAGDLTQSCKSACAHFNPYNKDHGDPKDKNRHVGDLGNIYANEKGVVKQKLFDSKIKLSGKNSIIGRSVVIHEKPDDFGKGGLDFQGNVIDKAVHKESLKTGNAGARIACGVIGYSAKNFNCKLK